MLDFLGRELQRAIQEGSPKPLIICGAGVSIQATRNKALGWSKLIEAGIQRVVDLDANAETWVINSRAALIAGGSAAWIKVADDLTDRLGGSDNAEFGTWLREAAGDLKAEQTNLVEAILALDCPIATTNYDDILCAVSGRPPITWSEHAATLECLAGKRPGILHLHGHWRTPASVVLGSKSYERHSEDKRRKSLQDFMTIGRPTVFVGCSEDGINDPDFNQLSAFISDWKDVAERRYWLLPTRDKIGTVAPRPSPDHERRLYPTFYTGAHDALAPFLNELAPPTISHVLGASNLADQVICIDEHIPPPEIFGREREVEAVVDALMKDRFATIAGGPGMGKTAIAISALYDERVVRKFARRRVFVSLEAETEPRALLARLIDALGLRVPNDGVSLLRMLRHHATNAPIAAILDNVEGIFDANTEEAERLINLAAQVPGVSVILTMRGSPASIRDATTIQDLERLDDFASKQAFLSVSGKRFEADRDLPHLLGVLDGHALSLRLVAGQAIALPLLAGLRERWELAHAEVLRKPGAKETRLTSVRVSLALSLATPRMKATPLAGRLFSILAYLPGGLLEDKVRNVLGAAGAISRDKASLATACLYEAQLVERRTDHRLRVLTPLRECAKIDLPFLSQDKKRILDHYLHRAASYSGLIGGSASSRADRSKWLNVRSDEIDNFDSIACLIPSADFGRSIAMRALGGIAKIFEVLGRGIPRSVDRANRLLAASPPSAARAHCHLWMAEGCSDSQREIAAGYLREGLREYRIIGDEQGEVNCGTDLAAIDIAHSNYSAARTRINEALRLATKIGYKLGQANCISRLAQIESYESSYVAAIARHQEALALYRQIGDLLGEANCYHDIADINVMQMSLQAARRQVDLALVIYRETGMVLGEANCLSVIAAIEFQLGRFSESDATSSDARRLYERVGDVTGEANCIALKASIRVALSDGDEARTLFEEAVTLYRQTGSVIGVTTYFREMAQLSLMCGDYSIARSQCVEAISLQEKMASPFHIARGNQTLATVDVGEGKFESARNLAKEALAIFRKIGTIGYEADCLAEFGKIDVFEDKLVDAECHFREAQVIYERIENVRAEAQCAIFLGNCVTDRKQRLAAIDDAFGRLFQRKSAEDLATPGWHAVKRAMVAQDDGEASEAWKDARETWSAIGRLDLVRFWSAVVDRENVATAREAT